MLVKNKMFLILSVILSVCFSFNLYAVDPEYKEMNIYTGNLDATRSDSGIDGQWLRLDTANSSGMNPYDTVLSGKTIHFNISFFEYWNIDTAGNFLPSSVNTWTERQPAGDVDKNWYIVSSDGDGSNLMAGSSDGIGRLYTSSDYGANWVERRPKGDVDGQWIGADSDTDGSNLIAGDYAGRLYTSSDFGANWTERRPKGDVNGNWWSASSDENGSHLIVSEYPGRVYTSDDSGATWTERQPAGDTDKNWSGTASDNDGSNLAVTGQPGRVYTSANFGVAWTERKPAGDIDKEWWSIDSDSDGSNLITAVASFVTQGRLYTTDDFGTTWTERQPAGDADQFWGGMGSDADGSHLIVCIYGGRIYISENFGVTWTEQRPVGDANKNWQWTDIDNDGSHLIACTIPGRIYTTNVLIVPDIGSDTYGVKNLFVNNTTTTNNAVINTAVINTLLDMTEEDIINVEGISLDSLSADGTEIDILSQLNIQTDKIIVCDVFTSDGINACIDALGAEGGCVILPEGTYTIDGTITIDYDNTTIKGMGWGTILDANAWSTDHVINLNGKDYCQVLDLQIIGNTGGGQAKDLIYGSGSTYSEIAYCYLKDSDQTAIFLDTDSDYANIHHNLVINPDDYGIFIKSGTYSQVNNNVVGNCGTNFGIVITSNSTHSIANNNTVFSSPGGIIVSNGSNGSTVNGNVINACSTGLYMQDNDCTCNGNTVKDGNIGIHLATGLRITVQGNTIISAAQQGIKVRLASNDANITGNIISGGANTYDDILIDATDSGIVSNNKLLGTAGNAERGISLVNSNNWTLNNNQSEGHDTAGIETDVNSQNNHIVWNNLESEAVAKITNNGGATNTIVNATAGDTLFYAAQKINLRDTAIGIYSQADTFLDLFADGAIRFGDSSGGAPTNYSQFSSDGTLTMTGTARVQKHVHLPLDTFLPGSQSPTAATIGHYSGFTYSQAVTQTATAVWHVPVDWDSTTDMVIHLHWAPIDANAGDVVWDIDYKATASESNEILTGTQTSLSTTDPTQTLQYEHLQTDDLTIPASDLAVLDMIGICLSRDTGDAADTYGAGAFAFFLEIIYTANKLGESL